MDILVIITVCCHTLSGFYFVLCPRYKCGQFALTLNLTVILTLTRSAVKIVTYVNLGHPINMAQNIDIT